MSAGLALALATTLPWRAARGQSAPTVAAREADYAALVARSADGAIHRLDFFPAQAQLRVQSAFLDARSLAAVPFAEIRRRADAGSVAVDEAVTTLGRTRVEGDLGALHDSLVVALRGAAGALADLAGAASACDAEPASVLRCQSPFAAASTELATAYRGYLGIRRRIAEQILDSGARLAAFISSEK